MEPYNLFLLGYACFSVYFALRSKPGDKAMVDALLVLMLFVWYYVAIAALIYAIVNQTGIILILLPLSVAFYTWHMNNFLNKGWIKNVYCFLKLKRQDIKNGETHKFMEIVSVNVLTVLLFALLFPFKPLLVLRCDETRILKTHIQSYDKWQIEANLDVSPNRYEVYWGDGIHEFHVRYFKGYNSLAHPNSDNSRNICIWFGNSADAAAFKIKFF